ncbi:2010_t:CDS:2, partial [Paraglomus brasilianum]
ESSQNLLSAAAPFSGVEQDVETGTETSSTTQNQGGNTRNPSIWEQSRLDIFIDLASLLVGLRWWNDIQEDGTNVWMFESRDPSRPINQTDSRVFWISLYVTLVIWFFFGFFALIKPPWLLIVVVALTLNIANVIGYTQCDKDAKRKWASGLAARAASSNSGVIGKLFSFGFGKLFT